MIFNMKKVIVYYIDLKDKKTDNFLKNKYSDEFLNVKDERKRMQLVASFYLKEKYIGDYHLTENKKPISDKCYFNVTHTGDYIFLAKSDFKVGIDAEMIKKRDRNLFDRYCSEKEIALREEVFEKIWTSKESLSKCIGTGLARDIKTIPCHPYDGCKRYEDNFYFSKMFCKDNIVISVTLLSEEDFIIDFIKEKM